MGRRGTRLAVVALAGVAGVLLLLDVHLLQSPIDVSPVAPPMGKVDARLQDSPELATALDKRTVEQFQETVNRPLFNPTRRPVQRNAAAASAPELSAGKLRLIGVMRLGQEPRRALIRFADERTGRWLAEGGTHKGWTLRKVNADSVVVQADGRSRELKLFPPRRSASPPGAKAQSAR